MTAVTNARQALAFAVAWQGEAAKWHAAIEGGSLEADYIEWAQRCRARASRNARCYLRSAERMR